MWSLDGNRHFLSPTVFGHFRVPVQVFVVPSHVRLLLDSFVTLTCLTKKTALHVDGYTLSTRYTWYHNRNIIYQTNGTNAEANVSCGGQCLTLSATNNSSSAAGNYTCAVTLTAEKGNGTEKMSSDVGFSLVSVEKKKVCISSICNEVLLSDLFPYGESYGDAIAKRSLDRCTAISLWEDYNVTLRFFPGSESKTVYVSNLNECE